MPKPFVLRSDEIGMCRKAESGFESPGGKAGESRSVPDESFTPGTRARGSKQKEKKETSHRSPNKREETRPVAHMRVRYRAHRGGALKKKKGAYARPKRKSIKMSRSVKQLDKDEEGRKKQRIPEVNTSPDAGRNAKKHGPKDESVKKKKPRKEKNPSLQR